MYIRRFCTDCKNKVLRAYNILVGDLDCSKEKGYCAALYEGLRCCPHERHIHVCCETDFIAHLLGRAEPEFAGGYEWVVRSSIGNMWSPLVKFVPHCFICGFTGGGRDMQRPWTSLRRRCWRVWESICTSGYTGSGRNCGRRSKRGRCSFIWALMPSAKALRWGCCFECQLLPSYCFVWRVLFCLYCPFK